MSLLKEISELVRENVISQETADKIKNYYSNTEKQTTNKLFAVFGVLGATLVGLGLILIIAHNWDELSRATKTIFAFIPLLIGQVMSGYSLVKKSKSVAWIESSAAFLFFSIGLSISLVGQIYNIPGSFNTFMVVWMLLSLPLVYILKSHIVSLFYLVGITYYAIDLNYFTFSLFNKSESITYWILLLLILPNYYLLYKNKPKSNFMVLNNWLIPISIIITLATVVKKHDFLIFVAYFSLYGLFYLIGNADFFKHQKLRNNSYKILGSLGAVILLILFSFNSIWKDLRREELIFNEVIKSPEFIVSTLITITAMVLLFFQMKNKSIKEIKPIAPTFILFIIIFIIGLKSPIAVVLINIVLFIVGLLTIKEGAKQNHLGILNYGLLIITAMVVSRFFDTKLSFVIRGILFILVGVGFFITNYWMLKKRKLNE